MSFDFQPALKGNLVELRPLKEDDFDKLHAVASDPLIWEQHPYPDRYKENVFREFFQASIKSAEALVVTDSKNGAIIGSSRFHGYDSLKSEIEIGWTFLARAYWGKGHNQELKKLMFNHAFKVVNNVVFIISPDNIRSQKSVEKIGAIRIGSRPDALGLNCHLYQINFKAFVSADN